MLDTIIIVLVLLWALGFVGGFAQGSLIHLVLVVAAIVLIIRVVQGRRLS